MREGNREADDAKKGGIYVYVIHFILCQGDVLGSWRESRWVICSTIKPYPSVSRPRQHQARLSAMLTPPYHFAIVASPLGQGCQDAAAADTSQILYRGALPAVRNAPFVRRLGLRTLVCLRKKPLKEEDAFTRWATRRGIDVKWIKAETMGEETLGMERADVSEALKVRPLPHGKARSHGLTV